MGRCPNYSLVRQRPFSIPGSGDNGTTAIPEGKDSRLSERLVHLLWFGRIGWGDSVSASYDESNLTVYLKLNELAEVVNAQSEFIREIDGLFRAIAQDRSPRGVAARKLLEQYLKGSRLPAVFGIKPIDIPPVIPGTLEVNRNGQQR